MDYIYVQRLGNQYTNMMSLFRRMLSVIKKLFCRNLFVDVLALRSFSEDRWSAFLPFSTICPHFCAYNRLPSLLFSFVLCTLLPQWYRSHKLSLASYEYNKSGTELSFDYCEGTICWLPWTLTVRMYLISFQWIFSQF